MSNRENTRKNLEKYEEKGLSEHLIAEANASDEFGDLEMGPVKSIAQQGVSAITAWLSKPASDNDSDPQKVKAVTFDGKPPDQSEDYSDDTLKEPNEPETDPIEGGDIGLKEVDPGIVNIAEKMCEVVYPGSNTYQIKIPSGFEDEFTKFLKWVGQTSNRVYKAVNFGGDTYTVVTEKNKKKKESLNSSIPISEYKSDSETTFRPESVKSTEDAVLVSVSVAGSYMGDTSEPSTSAKVSLMAQLSHGVKIYKKNDPKKCIRYTLKNIGIQESEVVSIISKNVKMDMKELIKRILKKNGSYDFVRRAYNLESLSQ